MAAVASVGASGAVAEDSATTDTTKIFDPSANVVLQTLENHGYEVGALVAPKKVDAMFKKPKADEQFEVGHVNDDGTVGIHPVGADGKVDKAKVVMTDQVQLRSAFKTVEPKLRLSKWDALSSDPPTLGQEFYLSVGRMAIASAYYQHRNCPAGSIYIQKTPAVKVIVVAAPKDGFVLTPYPGIVAGKAKDIRPVHLNIATLPPVDFNIDKPPEMDALQTLEFWRVRRSSDKDNANMHISMVEVTCPLPKLAKDFPRSIVVKVPTAVPFKKIAKNDELVLYIPEEKKKTEKKEKLLPVMHEPVSKKARTAE